MSIYRESIRRINSQILNTIKDFKRYEKNKVLEKTFMDGYCYDFARLLKRNFFQGRIFFLPREKHYIFEYNNIYYDIRGDITHLVKGQLMEEDDYIDQPFDR